MSKKTAKARRKALAQEAMATIEKMSNEELKNLRHEIGRTMALLANETNQLRIRLETIRRVEEHRRTTTPAGIHISEHAVVRYLERHKGLDVAAIRQEIVDMAIRAGKVAPKDTNSRGRRLDAETGLILGFDEDREVVTTILTDEDERVMTVS